MKFVEREKFVKALKMDRIWFYEMLKYEKKEMEL